MSGSQSQGAPTPETARFVFTTLVIEALFVAVTCEAQVSIDTQLEARDDFTSSVFLET